MSDSPTASDMSHQSWTIMPSSTMKRVSKSLRPGMRSSKRHFAAIAMMRGKRLRHSA